MYELLVLKYQTSLRGLRLQTQFEHTARYGFNERTYELCTDTVIIYLASPRAIRQTKLLGSIAILKSFLFKNNKMLRNSNFPLVWKRKYSSYPDVKS